MKMLYFDWMVSVYCSLNSLFLATRDKWNTINIDRTVGYT